MVWADCFSVPLRPKRASDICGIMNSPPLLYSIWPWRVYSSDPDLMNKITISAAKYYQKWATSNDLPPIRIGTPAENRRSFRRIIQSCTGFVYWMDLYIGKEGLEFLVDSFDHQNVFYT
jgi:hypothetical protein